MKALSFLFLCLLFSSAIEPAIAAKGTSGKGGSQSNAVVKVKTMITKTTFSSSSFDIDSVEHICGGEGIAIYADDIKVGMTDAKGEATVAIPSERVCLTAIMDLVKMNPHWDDPGCDVSYGESEGRLVLEDLTPGERREVVISLDGGGDVESYFGSEMVVDETRDGILPRNVSRVTCKFFNSQGKRLKIVNTEPSGIELSVPRPDMDCTDVKYDYCHMDNLFSADKSGVLVLHDTTQLRGCLPSGPVCGKVQLTILAYDEEGLCREGTIGFFVGDHSLRVRTLPPPSAPKLSMKGLAVKIELEGEFDSAAGDFVPYQIFKPYTIFEIEKKTDPKGRLFIPSFPQGHVVIRAEKTVKGKRYVGEAPILFDRDVSVDIVLLGEEDISNDVAPFFLEE